MTHGGAVLKVGDAGQTAAGRPEPQANFARDRNAEFASSYCPRCSARLEGRSCRLICPGCGYYMSCSDFY